MAAPSGQQMWRTAREQLGAYEQRAAELGAALQAELDARAAEEAEIASLRAGAWRAAGDVAGPAAAPPPHCHPCHPLPPLPRAVLPSHCGRP